MSIHLPNYTYIGVDGFEIYPGTAEAPGIHHRFTTGLHLIAGVNGLEEIDLPFPPVQWVGRTRSNTK